MSQPPIDSKNARKHRPPNTDIGRGPGRRSLASNSLESLSRQQPQGELQHQATGYQSRY